MLSGEYAALVGGRAVIIPINDIRLIITEAMEPSSAFTSPVIENALKIAIPELEQYERKSPLKYIVSENSGFFSSDGNKLGVGLSAAEAVATISLRYARAGFDTAQIRKSIAAYALQAHRNAQGGIGSGADVYCCAYGIPIIYQYKDTLSEPVIIQQMDLPDIPIHLVYTGRGSNTREAVLKFEKWCNKSDESDRVLLKELIQHADEIASIWTKFERKSFLNAVNAFVAVMRETARRAGTEYWISVHDDLKSWADNYDGIVKPVGAGGGDMALLIGDMPIDEIAPSKYAPYFKIN